MNPAPRPGPPPGTVVAVVGPTAAGKTALSLDLAEALDAEVVNADSMQLYRGMDIGTAKVPVGARRGVPHHVLDVWDVAAPASVAEYQRLARAAIDDIHARGRTALLVGGSGLYVRAALEEFAFPGTDPAARADLEAELAEVGPAVLHARLAALDPAAALAILPGNGRRIVRALEVIGLTGQPFTAALPTRRPHYPHVSLGVDRAVEELDDRIAVRVTRMWADGLLEEVAALADRGLREGRTAGRALGYQQALAQLDGACDAAAARAGTVQATRRFVRRQRTWFRRDPAVVWLDGARADLGEAAVAAVAAASRAAPGGGAS
ncbi:tRNA dimethylallyltransferase [Pilimelia terevasa]|uniref:tRNA dimethylallyltransferase n=1 Tax=Pilimelia terevasa TaxID=53372 RepID=A0A8J3FH42_9ACTN|nr:tRNA (adenosine(37)-N6)-dimethylallyltransferase MiaA [Pilimelia terevasa]GGK27413.1 tRNA dimethylallyltransferase [Pilimelia terevasa]